MAKKRSRLEGTTSCFFMLPTNAFLQALLTHNATVYIAGRTPQKVQGAIDDLRGEIGKAASFLQLDLADLSSIKNAVLEFLRYVLEFCAVSYVQALSHRRRLEQRLDVLFNSAGLMYPAVDLVTKDGYDMQFGTNVGGRPMDPILPPSAFSFPARVRRALLPHQAITAAHDRVCEDIS